MEKLEDKVKNVLNIMKDSIKRNTNDEKQLNRIEAIKNYINNKKMF